MKFWRPVRCVAWLVVCLAACSISREEPQIVIYITATFSPQTVPTEVVLVPTSVPQDLSPLRMIQPSPDPARHNWANSESPREHIVQVGDTLYSIALAYGVSLDSVLAANAELADPNSLSVGQVINLPGIPTQQTSGFKIIPDSRLVRGPDSPSFDVAAFINQQPGYIRISTDRVSTRQSDGSTVEDILPAAHIVERVAIEYSIDPRLLLALLEYRAGWLSNPVVPEAFQLYPMIAEENSQGVDRSGLYRQLAWAANQLNWGYYGWKTRGWTTLEFIDDGVRLLYDPGLNAGTVAVQYFLSLNSSYSDWRAQIDSNSFYHTYVAYFGDPFANAIEPLVPSDLEQPPMMLPFASGETWFFTGGWHGGWGSGSAWSALDFAPPDDVTDVLCYTSSYRIRAVASGVIARSGGGVVVLDLDGDGNEATGWTVLYLHVASQDRVSRGTVVQAGDPIGFAACEGGFSTATHLHIARRYNGEWIPADCPSCTPLDPRPAFVLSGWRVYGIVNQEYQGYMEREGERRHAEQGRLTPDNRVSW